MMSFVAQSRISRRRAISGAGATGIGMLSFRSLPGIASAQDASPSPATDYPEVVITAVEYHLDLPEFIPGGFTKLTLDNQGTHSHHAMFLKLNDGVTAEDLAPALATPDLGAIFSMATSLGGPEVEGGHSASVILDLPPGQYVVFCLIPDEENVPHYMHGMHVPLEVTEATDRPAPTADAQVEMVDFGFKEMPMQAASGTYIWEVSNDGEQLHQFLVQRQSEGVTFEQIQAMLAAPAGTPAAEGPPPYIIIGGAAPMSPGTTVYSILELEAGDYFAICFIPDPATGAPHFALGMIMPFTVV